MTENSITEYQPLYFVAESFSEMKEQVRKFAETELKRPMVLRYNALTQGIEVLDTKDKVKRYASNIRGEMSRLVSAIEKLP